MFPVTHNPSMVVFLDFYYQCTSRNSCCSVKHTTINQALTFSSPYHTHQHTEITQLQSLCTSQHGCHLIDTLMWSLISLEEFQSLGFKIKGWPKCHPCNCRVCGSLPGNLTKKFREGFVWMWVDRKITSLEGIWCWR